MAKGKRVSANNLNYNKMIGLNNRLGRVSEEAESDPTSSVSDD